METKELQEKLLSSAKNVYDTRYRDEQEKIMAFCGEYAAFLNAAKTERRSVSEAVKIAEESGFVPLADCASLKPGDRVYTVNRHKGVVLAVIGSRPLDGGVNIVAAHIDAPRLDFKPNPLYEDMSLALLKTHYYGGIKKYQWTAMPLALTGVVYTADGDCVEVSIGSGPDDPVLCITDLLPHLAGDQMGKKMSQGIEGEALNLLIGGIPFEDKDAKERVKLNVMRLLNEKYGMTERDFVSAELEAVPAFDARDVGLDRSFIGAYGQDDRVCAYTALRAICAVDAPQKTAVCMLVDKEEIGSAGNTGMKSRYFENFIYDLCEKTSADGRHCLSNSACLSADVGAANDPNYASVQEKRNAAVLNGGILLMKYTGSRGKSGSSDASAEFMNKIIRLFDRNEVVWQTGELGKVDAGGGGTVAQYVAQLDVDVVDCGVPLLSMHAPFEIAAKADVYMAYLAYRAFLRDNQ